MSVRLRQLVGVINRFIYLAVLTALLVVGGYVYLENTEVHKIWPPTRLHLIGMLLAQSLTLAGANYLLAIKGKNFTEPKAEVAFLFACILALVSFEAPYMFERQIGVDIIERLFWWDTVTPIIAPDRRFGWLIYPSIWLGIYSIVNVWRHFGRKVSNPGTD